jgi:hypothetical protein
VQATGDSVLASLLEELRAYPVPGGAHDTRLEGEHVGVALPLRMRAADGSVLSFISTTTVFGTAVDVTVQELTLETFFPLDAATAEHLRQVAASA